MDLTELELTIKKPNDDFEKKCEELLPKLHKYFELSEKKDDLLVYKLKDDAPKGNIKNIRKILDDIMIYSVFKNPSYFLIPSNAPDLYWPQAAYLYALSFILGDRKSVV